VRIRIEKTGWPDLEITDLLFIAKENNDKEE
jgi:hypothetical protein